MKSIEVLRAELAVAEARLALAVAESGSDISSVETEEVTQVVTIDPPAVTKTSGGQVTAPAAGIFVQLKTHAPRHRVRWTEVEDVIASDPNRSHEEVARLTGRTVVAVRVRRTELGVRISKEVRRATHATPHGWTDDEDMIALDESLSLREKSELLGRSLGSVSGRRSHLKNKMLESSKTR